MKLSILSRIAKLHEMEVAEHVHISLFFKTNSRNQGLFEKLEAASGKNDKEDFPFKKL